MENNIDIRTIEQIRYINWAFRLPIRVGFSGGKDSIVLWDLVKRSGVLASAQYNMTTVDPPELVQFIRKEYPEVIRSRPKETMWKLIVKKRMPPTRIIRYCCSNLKEKKFDGITLTGIRAEESNARKRRRPIEIQCKKRVLIHPIFDWTEVDVWEYIDERKLPYPSLYEEAGISRIGCVGCPMGGRNGRLRGFERWPKYKEAYIRAFDRCVKARIRDGLKYKGPHKKWTTGQEMFDWWMTDDKKFYKKNKKQVEIFTREVG